MRSAWRKWSACLLISCLGIGVAGCWDYHDLENRAIVVGLGIDEMPPTPAQNKELRMYQLIVQIVEPASEASGGPMSRGSGGSVGTNQKGYTNLIIETMSIAEGLEEIVTRSDRTTNLAHLQLIALGERVAKKGINELNDFLTRFPQMRRHTEILVLNGPISEFFTTPSVSEPTPALHMAEMVNNVEKTIIMTKSNLGTVTKAIREGMPFMMLYGSLDKKKQIVLNEAAVFEGIKMRGVLSKEQMQTISILQGDIQRGFLEFSCSGAGKIGTLVLSGKTRVQPSLRNGKPHVTFRVRMESEMVEYQCRGQAFEKPEQIRKLEKMLSAKLEERLLQSAKGLQAAYEADLFRLTKRVKNDLDMYRMIREQPKNFFRQLTMEVQVDFKIRTIGNTLATPPGQKKE